jgi:hypothetical protein
MSLQYCKSIPLKPILQPVHGEIPFYIKPEYWTSAIGNTMLCGYPDGTGQLVVRAKNLHPSGVYTVWFVTDQGAYPAAPKGATFTSDGFDPNRPIVNSKGELQYYIAHLNYNPIDGIPMNNQKMKILSVVLAFHPDNTTHGLVPGPHVEHLSGSV